MEAYDKYQKAKRSITIAQKLSKNNITYKNWNNEEVTDCCEPLYYSQTRLTNVRDIKTLSSSGFINVVRRRMNLSVPSLVYKGKNISGTPVAYINFFKGKSKKLSKFGKLSLGDLLIWKPVGSSQGHMAIYFEKHFPMESKESTEEKSRRKDLKKGFVWHCVQWAGVTETSLEEVHNVLKNEPYVVSRDIWLYE